MRKLKTVVIIALTMTVTACSGYYMTGGGYLNRYAQSNLILQISPPKVGSREQKQDHDVFIKTRVMKGSARWQQATSDATASNAQVLAGFNCAVGRELSVESMPEFTRLLAKTEEDTERLVRHSKDYYKIKRPYVLYKGEVCSFVGGYDYPSGHAMVGWTMARLLALVYPERRQAIETHARVIAESRVICGAHSLSAVEVDEYYSQKIFDRLVKLPAFQQALQSVRKEMAGLPVRASQSQRCEKFSPQYVKPFTLSYPKL